MKDTTRFKVVEITPDMARKWLENNNPHNRNVYERVVLSYARDMATGNWVVNNQGIGFDSNGNLVDGQHRLYACIRANRPFKSLVVLGLPVANGNGIRVQMTIDQGKSRQAGDVFSLAYGVKDANHQAAITRGLVDIVTMAAGIKTRSRLSIRCLAEIRELYEDEIEIAMGGKSGAIRGLVYSPTMAAFAFAAKPFPEKVREFIAQYYSGENIHKGDPALTLRNYMLARSGWKVRGGSVRSAAIRATLQALEKHVKGEKLKISTQSMAGLAYFTNNQKYFVNKVIEITDI